MIVIEPTYEILVGLDQTDLVTRIEACGRVCYKSEDKISRGSALPFVKKIAKHGHNSVLEMAVLTLKIRCSVEQKNVFLALQPKYFMVDTFDDRLLVTGSIRAFREIYLKFPDNAVVLAMVSFLNQKHPYLFEGVWETSSASGDSDITVTKVELDEVDKLPGQFLLRHRYVAVKFIVNRAVTHELVRHRPCSFLQESQRYCRYSQDKFDNQVTFIKPMFYEEGSEEYSMWKKAMEETESIYLQLLTTSTPQAARTVLPNSCKTEIIVNCNLEEWQHILKLRTPANAEPSMREIMIPFGEEMKTRYPIAY